MIRVVIAEDHPITQSGISYLLNETPGIELTEAVTNGVDALRAVEEHKPDVLILDMMLPRGSGLYVLNEIQRKRGPSQVIVYSGQSSAKDFNEALENGARGLISKSDDPAVLLEAIQLVAAGKQFVSPSVEQRLAVQPSTQTALNDSLTPREQQILVLVAEGMSSQEISDRLNISSATVKKHRANLMAKLHLKSAAEATRYALRTGLISIPR